MEIYILCAKIILFKGTVTQDFDADFFIPIDRPDLGDGPLRGKTLTDAHAQRNKRFTCSSVCSF